MAAPFTITVVVDLPAGGRAAPHELPLVKAAALYADKVELISLRSAGLMALRDLEGLTTEERFDFIETTAPLIGSDPNTGHQLADLRRRLQPRKSGKRLGPKEALAKAKLDALVKRMWPTFVAESRHWMSNFGFDPLLELAEAGILEVRNLLDDGTTRARQVTTFIEDSIKRAKHREAHGTRAPDDAQDTVLRYVDAIGASINDPSTYPLFDDRSGELTRLAVAESHLDLDGSSLRRGRHVGLAADLLQRLPLFDDASIETLLQIRGELDPHLVRFRSAIMGFSENISSAQWDRSFAGDAETVFRRDVEPAIAELEDATRDNKFLRNLYEAGIAKPGRTGLGVFLSQLDVLPSLAAVAIGLGTAADVVVRARENLLSKRANLEKHGLFFYYRAAKHLVERHG